MANIIQAKDLTIDSELLSAGAIDGKYDKTGGEISGDVSILSGSFSGGIGATATGANSFAYGTGVFAIGENSYAVGKDSVAGCYGWYYDHIDFTNNVFYLTTTQPNTIYTSALTGIGEVDPNFNSGFEVGDVISYVNKKKFDLALSVVAVNGNQISVEPFKDTGKYSLAEIEPNHDDWTIFCPKKPLIGEIWLGEVSYAEGLNSIALNAYSHAEGKGGFAYGQYAHVEGKRNTAGYASHAEGADVSAIAQYCHAEGFSSIAAGQKSHAEGVNTTASGNDSHAEGNLAVASGAHSHAEGSSTAASGSTSHAEGYLTKAVGFAGHAEGQSTVAKGEQSHAEGAGSSTLQTFKVTGAANSKTYTTDKNHSLHVNNIVQYDKTYAKIVAVPELTSFTLDQTLDAVNDLVDVDINLIKGIAYNNKSHVEGQNSIATGETSHAEGGATLASGKFSHSEGYKTEANGVCSHAAGASAITNANCSYVWNGLSSAAYKVLSTDIGTFNINPKDGLAGFCIGHHSLIENSSPVSSLSTTVIYKTGEISTFLIEGELLSSSIPNIKNAVDVTIGNAVTSIGVKAFFQCDALTCVQMPNSLTAVMNTAFSKCTALTSLVFPDSVLSIDYSGFSNCTNLRIVKFPKGLTKIPDYISYNCPKLVDVVIPNTISAIGKQSFMNCTGLIHVNIPNSITTIGLSAFTNCSSLTSVEFEYRTLEQISTIPNYSPSRWGLTDDAIIKPYDWSQTNGYFNVNPTDGLSGFYIGTDNFISCIVKAVQVMSDDQKADLKTALGL